MARKGGLKFVCTNFVHVLYMNFFTIYCKVPSIAPRFFNHRVGPKVGGCVILGEWGLIFRASDPKLGGERYTRGGRCTRDFTVYAIDSYFFF